MPIITLLTDFQDADGFVGVMKGVLAGIAPQAPTIDLTHHVPPGDIAHAAFVLHTAWPWFPTGTVHLAVVDPGVGGARRGLALRAFGHCFVLPDNGLAAWVVHELTGAGERVEAWHLTDPRFRLDPPSTTFHGRDVFAPAAAFLACGVDPGELGPSLDGRLRPEGDLEPGPVSDLLPRSDDAQGVGRIIHVDTFGNGITSLPSAMLAGREPASVRLEVTTADGPLTVSGWYPSYSGGPRDRPFLVAGSSGLIEIAWNGSSAATRSGFIRGDVIRLEA